MYLKTIVIIILEYICIENYLPEKEEKFKPLKVDPPSTKLDNSVTSKDYESKLLCYELQTLLNVTI